MLPLIIQLRCRKEYMLKLDKIHIKNNNLREIQKKLYLKDSEDSERTVAQSLKIQRSIFKIFKINLLYLN